MYTTVNKKQDDLEVIEEQTSQLYASVNKAIVATIINSIILVSVLWQVVDHKLLLGWFFSLALVSVLRSYVSYRYKTSSIALREVYFWRKRFITGSVFASVLWGASAFWIFPTEDLARQVFLAFVIGGMVAAAITTLSYNKITIYIFLSFSLIPLIIRFFMGESDLSLVMGAMIALYYVMMLQSAKLTHSKYIESIQARIENLQQLRSLNETEARYKTLLDSATDAFFLHDLNGRILDVNKQACRSLGYSKDELLKLTVSDIDVDRGKNNVIWDELKKDENVRLDSTHQRKDGTTFPVEVSLGYVCMDDEPLLSVLARDITERKRVEKMKNEFVSTVSHELRTPLTSIKGGLGLLTGGALGEIPQQANEILNIASHNTDSLLLLVNDILDMQKIESGELEMEFEKMAVLPFLKQSLQDNKAYAEQYKVVVTLESYDKELFVNANKDRLKQVMANLLSNAAKFSHENGSIEVVVSQPVNNIVRVSVTDHGFGIAKEFYPTIFDKFTQQDSSDTRQKGGTGLGLSISKAIIEKHGGEITFTSKEGEGTTFYFDLPEFVNNG